MTSSSMSILCSEDDVGTPFELSVSRDLAEKSVVSLVMMVG